MRYEVKRVLSKQEVEELNNQEVPVKRPTPIDYNSVVYDADTKKPLLIVTKYSGDFAEYRRALRRVKWSNNARASGMKNFNTNFGYTARVPVLRRMSCAICMFAQKQPEEHAIIEAAADVVWKQFQELLPEQAQKTADLASNVLPDWRMMETPWTSGVLNETSALYYHYDRNNFIGSWSAMLVARRDVRGGHLHLPEYDLTLACRDGDLILFPGSLLLHGVTPMVRNKDGYRISAVYYSIAKMEKCLPPEEELKHARAQRTVAAENLITRQKKHGLI